MPSKKHDDADRAPLRRRSISEALCHVLGNTCRIAATTQSFYWNVTGPQAASLKSIFAVQYREMHDALDRIAMRSRALGEFVAQDYSDAVLLPTLLAISSSKSDQMLKILIEAHEASLLSLDAAMDVADAYQDRTTVALLANREEVQGQHLLDLRSVLQG
ncbi:MAG: ferritin-like domain-containing protein [Pseudomonadota bacterium]